MISKVPPSADNPLRAFPDPREYSAGCADLHLPGLSAGQAITACVLPLHFEQDFCRILLALLRPVPNALNEFLEIFRCHGSNIANSAAPATAVSDVSAPAGAACSPPAPQFAARFSANEASPSAASCLPPLQECSCTSRS